MSYFGDPANSDKDRVRYEIGDTDPNEELLSDNEIEWEVSQHSSIWGACASCCEHIAAQFAKRVDTSTKSFDTKLSQKIEHYERMAETFRKKASSSNVGYIGGTVKSDKDTYEDDSDRVSPRFTRGMHDNT